MKRISLIILVVSGGLTVLLIASWLVGFIFAAQSVGNLIHLLLIFSFVTGFGVVVGAILLLISMIGKK